MITRRSLLFGAGALGRLAAAHDKYPVRFEDVAARAGLNIPTIYGGVTSNRYILETTGCGAAFFDYDNDGWLDIFLVNGATLDPGQGPQPSNRLLHNNRDGTFSDVTRRAGLTRSGWGQGVCVGDYDNDGYDELFITYWRHNILYHNNGDGTFTDVTAKARLTSKETQWGAGCAFLDYDSDGRLDLFVTNYIDLDGAAARHGLLPLPGVGSELRSSGSAARPQTLIPQ
jgi:hypothetical protein